MTRNEINMEEKVKLYIKKLKEYIWDKRLKKGTFEWKDIYFTCWGGILATILWYFL